ncbi:MAG: hypothetical protein QOI70_1618, partial [Microbacteriaceae bacterium]|nr:hypothetical protein [Microbacteriaceae bacterium]
MRIPAIQLRGITKSFGGTRAVDTIRAVDGIDLTIAQGEVVALLGP